MEKDAKSIYLVILMRDSLRTVRIMDLDNTLGLTVQITKVNLKIICQMAQALRDPLMEKSPNKESGKMMSLLESDLKLIKKLNLLCVIIVKIN